MTKIITSKNFRVGIILTLIQVPACFAMEVEKIKFEWDYIHEDYPNTLYLPHTIEINKPTLRGHQIAYVVPAILEVQNFNNGVNTTYYEMTYDCTICADLFSSYIVEYEIHDNSPLKLKFWEKPIIFNHNYKIGRQLSERKGIISVHGLFDSDSHSSSIRSEEKMESKSDLNPKKKNGIQTIRDYKTQEFKIIIHHDCPVLPFRSSDYSISPALELPQIVPVEQEHKKKYHFPHWKNLF